MDGRLGIRIESPDMGRKYGIYSCGGFAREVLPSLRDAVMATRQGAEPVDIVFIEDDPTKVGSEIHGVPVVSFQDLCDEEDRNRRISVAIADSAVRQRLVERCEGEGFGFFSITDPSHISYDNVQIGEGSIFCAFTMVTGDATIGKHFQCNIYSYVAHDCRIGDYVTFAPRVSCNGRVHIDDYAYIGTGAVIKHGSHDRPLRIGKGAVVGMGAVVLNDVADGEIVVGNPAKVLRRPKN
jgi:sugar O-acyltransferase (sialic acid O-acetyltransferase NeuD family)